MKTTTTWRFQFNTKRKEIVRLRKLNAELRKEISAALDRENASRTHPLFKENDVLGNWKIIKDSPIPAKGVDVKGQLDRIRSSVGLLLGKCDLIDFLEYVTSKHEYLLTDTNPASISPDFRIGEKNLVKYLMQEAAKNQPNQKSNV